MADWEPFMERSSQKKASRKQRKKERADAEEATLAAALAANVEDDLQQLGGQACVCNVMVDPSFVSVNDIL